MRLPIFKRLCAGIVLVFAVCGSARAQRPELVLQTGHASQILSAAFSSDAKLLATRGADGVKLWDIATGRMLRTFAPAQEIGSNVAFSPDDRSVAWGYKGEQKLEVRDLVRGELKLNLAGTPSVSGIHHIAFSADGGMIAAANADRTVTLWDARKGVALRVIKGFPAPVTAVAFSADGTRLTTTAEDLSGRAAGAIGVWEVATGKSLKSFKSGAGLGPLALSRDGGTVAASSAPGAACATKVWDAASSGVARELQTCSTYPVALSRDG
ncbi:MAG: hypothetical protein H7Z38_08095, partial [Rubrivivax sp.]|nr:hypothetical protein [Pyrinomonadaceae bacterium]